MTAPTIIGIDDWAIARGHRYGTIVVDLERRCPIELLPGREVATVIPWLKAQPGVEVIARDRAGAYADAACTAAPAAQQVADRWHLLANLRDGIERVLLRCTSQMKEAARQASEALRLETQAAEVPVKGPAMVDVPPLSSRQRHSDQRRALRMVRYEDVLHRHKAGESIAAIGRTMNLDRRTVRGFVQAGAFPERAPRSAVPTLLDAHRQYMAARAAEGCRNARQIWRELRERGFTGGHSIVREAFAQLRGQRPGSSEGGEFCDRTVAMPSTRRACAWVLDWRRKKHTETGQGECFVQALCRIEPEINTARHLAHQFLDLVRRHDLNGFDRWFSQARVCPVPELRRFAAGLQADLSAVRAAFHSQWSSGQVNRLKYLKCQMYGRAKLDLLRIRVLHPN